MRNHTPILLVENRRLTPAIDSLDCEMDGGALPVVHGDNPPIGDVEFANHNGYCDLAR
jgi:hypothetical protein